MDDVNGFLAFAGKLKERKLPPVESWHPSFCGDIDIRIARDGRWYHEGRIFQRDALTKLLSSILRKEGDEYFLVSPVEKMRIQVEDVPFLAIEMQQEKAPDQFAAFLFRTATDDIVRLDAEHPLRVQVSRPEQARASGLRGSGRLRAPHRRPPAVPCRRQSR